MESGVDRLVAAGATVVREPYAVDEGGEDDQTICTFAGPTTTTSSSSFSPVTPRRMLLEEVARASNVATTRFPPRERSDVSRHSSAALRPRGRSRSPSRTCRARCHTGRSGVGWATLEEACPRRARDPRAAPSRRACDGSAPSTVQARGPLDAEGSTTFSPRRRADGVPAGLLAGEIRPGRARGGDGRRRRARVVDAHQEVRRAAMLAGDLGTVAAAASEARAAALTQFRLSPMTPVQPMLAQSATDLPAAFDRIDPAAVEWKLDGARIQVHRLGDEVRVHAEPGRGDRSRSGDRRVDTRRAIGGGRARLGGDRPAPRRAPASVRRHDEPVRKPEPARPASSAPRSRSARSSSTCSTSTARTSSTCPPPNGSPPSRSGFPPSAALAADRDPRRRRGRGLPGTCP